MYMFALLAAIAFMPNDAGGEIVLTTEVPAACEGYNGFAYTTAPGQPTVPGCWTFDDRNVHIKWLLDGVVRSYPIGAFTKIQGV